MMLAAARARAVRLFRSAAVSFWDDLPAWFMFITVANTLFSYLSYLQTPRPEWTFTAIFPYGMFLWYSYAASISAAKAKGISSARRFLCIAGLTGIVLAAAAAFARPIRFGPDWSSHFDVLVRYYEFSNLLWALILAVHCAARRGVSGLVVFYVVGAIYGMILESGGVSMGFFSEDHYHWYLPGLSAPVATMFGWSTVFYPCVCIVDGIRGGFPRINRAPFFVFALLAAWTGLCFDAVVDPFATDFGLWVWNPIYRPDTSLYFCGVPIVNFVSWFSALFAFGFFYYYCESRARWSGVKRALAAAASLPAVLALASVIEFGTLAVIEGTNGPSWTILKRYLESGAPLYREPVREKRKDDAAPLRPSSGEGPAR